MFLSDTQSFFLITSYLSAGAHFSSPSILRTVQRPCWGLQRNAAKRNENFIPWGISQAEGWRRICFPLASAHLSFSESSSPGTTPSRNITFHLYLDGPEHVHAVGAVQSGRRSQAASYLPTSRRSHKVETNPAVHKQNSGEAKCPGLSELIDTAGVRVVFTRRSGEHLELGSGPAGPLRIKHFLFLDPGWFCRRVQFVKTHNVFTFLYR